jgi:hypothetical protein
MSNQLKYVKRVTQKDGKPTSAGYNVYAGHASLGHVVSLSGGLNGARTKWSAEYDHGEGWKSAGIWGTRDRAGKALLDAHEQRWGPLNGQPTDDGQISADAAVQGVNDSLSNRPDPRPVPSRYAVVGGQELRELRERINYAIRNQRPCRFTVHHGLKVDAGYGWSPVIGRPADETGH